MATLKFTKDHEWVSVEGDTATIGITNHAQNALGDVVFVEVPDVGRKVAAHEACAVVESVKAASDVYSPLTGEIVANNGALAGSPMLVNEDAQGKAWFFKLKIANPAEFEGLMDQAAYDAFCKES